MSRFQVLSDDEVARARASGKILRECLEEVSRRATEGVTTAELDRIAEEFIRSHGGEPAFKGYQGFPATLCTSINDACVHGIPGPAVLRNGDIVSLDCGVRYEGICTDACVTVLIGEVVPWTRRLVEVTREALDRACALVRAGIRVGDISAAVQGTVEEAGFHCMHALTGHGLGDTLHQFPDIPNVGTKGDGPVIPSSTLLAIEPITAIGTHRIREGNDGWTIRTADGSPSAHFEHTVLVLPAGMEILA